MVEIIAAVVVLIGSLVSNAISGQASVLAGQKAAEQAQISFEQQKSLKVYELLSTKEKQQYLLVGTITIGVVLFLIILLIVKIR